MHQDDLTPTIKLRNKELLYHEDSHKHWKYWTIGLLGVSYLSLAELPFPALPVALPSTTSQLLLGVHVYRKETKNHV